MNADLFIFLIGGAIIIRTVAVIVLTIRADRREAERGPSLARLNSIRR